MTDFAQRERAALADLLVSVGPDAPTLCSGWTARDLAAHLVVRASRADAAAGIVIPALAGHTRRIQQKVAAQPWDELIAKVRKPPWWAAIADEAVNRIEYFVHHEDVRRAQEGWQPRELEHALSAALFSRLRLQGKLALRRTPAAVTVRAPDFGSFTAGKGEAPVTLTGAPQELVLFLLGRQSHARVDLDGPEPIITRMRTAKYGI